MFTKVTLVIGVTVFSNALVAGYGRSINDC